MLGVFVFCLFFTYGGKEFVIVRYVCPMNGPREVLILTTYEYWYK